MRRFQYGLWVVVLSAPLGCAVDLDIADILAEGVEITCDAPDDCPSGFFCDEDRGLCFPEGQEREPPLISGFAVVGPDSYGLGTTIALTFQVNEELINDPVVTLLLPGESRNATIVSATAADPGPGVVYEYSYTVVDTDPEGPVSVQVSVVDVVGNPASAEFPNEVSIDLTAPDLGTSVVTYAFRGTDASCDSSSNLLSFDLGNVQAATTCTTVEVTFTLDELAAATPTVRGVCTSNCANIGQTLNFQASVTQGVFYIFTHEVLDSTAGGTFTIEVDVTDVAGNQSSPPLQAGSFDVDQTPPAAPTDTSLLRVPWGADNLVDSMVSYPDAVLSMQGSKDTDTILVAFDRAEAAGRIEFGRTPDFSTTTFDTDLNAADRPLVYVAAVDRAGNESAQVLVRSGTWLASLNGRLAGDDFSNPNRLLALTSSSPALFDRFAAEPPSSSLLALYASDSATTQVTASRTWNQLDLSTPGSRALSGMAHMSSSGLTYLFGGIADEGIAGDMWEWNGASWRAIDLSASIRPNPRIGAGFTYDSRRNRIVLFGGGNNLQNIFNDTWEWDGTSWSNVTQGDVNPPQSAFQSMTYDSARGVTVFFGGIAPADMMGMCPDGSMADPLAPLCPISETWEWDGISWTERCTDVSCSAPSPRFHAAMAYDPVADALILHGGSRELDDPAPFDDTWQWDPVGDTWVELFPAMAPSVRAGHRMAFVATEGASGALVLLGGCEGGEFFACGDSVGATGGLDDMWLWNAGGSTWESVTPTVGYPRRVSTALAYDSVRQQLVMHGGGSKIGVIDETDPPGPQCSDQGFFCPDGSPPDTRSTTFPNAECRCQHTRTVLYEGGAWRLGSSVGGVPEVVRRPKSAYDSVRDRVVTFGGSDAGDDCDGSGNGTCDTLWEWDGLAWERMCDPSMPACGTLYVAGTFTTGDDCNIVLGTCPGGAPPVVNDPGGGVRECLCTHPSGREEHAMTFVPDGVGGGVTLMFGGNSAGGASCDSAPSGAECTKTWMWDESGWAEWIQAVGPVPEPRNFPAMTTAIDPGTGEGIVYMYGGGRQNTGACPAGVSTGIDFNMPADGDDACLFHDLWTWDGTNGWAQVGPAAPAGTPGGLTEHAMTYDSINNQVVLYGGCNTASANGSCPFPGEEGYPSSGIPEQQDTWVWSPPAAGTANNWTLVESGSPPGPLRSTKLTYDSTRARTLLFGGTIGDGNGTNAVWEWDGQAWSEVAQVGLRPPPRRRHTMVYQTARRKVMVFGDGLPGEFWEWDVDPDLRPAAVWEFSWNSTGVVDPITRVPLITAIQGVTLTIDATGQGFELDTNPSDDGDLIGEPIAGFDVEIWNSTSSSWTPFPGTCAGAGTVTTCTTSDAAAAQASIFPGSNKFYARVTPTGGGGNGPSLASIELDYAEVSIEYLWP